MANILKGRIRTKKGTSLFKMEDVRKKKTLIFYYLSISPFYFHQQTYKNPYFYNYTSCHLVDDSCHFFLINISILISTKFPYLIFCTYEADCNLKYKFSLNKDNILWNS
ncbi:hypothetical protein VCUG_01816 [Vavraia culicis subsp. floridensis]|uniref:Uncharacterized protein n=1 Tax=Vavraia culicis (isolate floridensis) TaxID=948595 RepID=L2GSL9_VAVCU|nr:uncharacterized protein VCUG_01816 [Vavraia culicis subsp. floridensis]ELA46666.1 hypothetical protein VCUG_01816 [Vavraia culicis subsp. floridensis]